MPKEIPTDGRKPIAEKYISLKVGTLFEKLHNVNIRAVETSVSSAAYEYSISARM